MKILFLTDNFLPHFGGSRVYYYNLCKNLPQNSVYVFTNKIKGSDAFDVQQSFLIYRLPLDCFKCISKLLNEIWIIIVGLLAGGYLVCKHNINILHCGEILPMGIVGFILSKIFKIPYIIYTHSEDVGVLRSLKGERKLGVFILRNASKVISACKFGEDQLIKLGIPEDKIFRLTPGVEDFFLRKINYSDIEKFKEDKNLKGRKILLTVGRLIKRKNHISVIKSLPCILKEVPQVLYLVIGRGPEENYLKELTEKMGLASCVRFEGEVSKEELFKYYACCDVFVMVSKECKEGDVEGLGIVFLEANALGKPVVGPNTGGPAEYIAHNFNGMKVNPDSQEEICKALIRLLKEERLCKKLGDNGRRIVNLKFRWKDKADLVYKLSLSLVNAKN